MLSAGVGGVCVDIFLLSITSLYFLSLSGRVIVVVVLLFYVHGKHLRSCRDGQLT